MEDRTYHIIQFTAAGKEYYGDSIRLADILLQSGKYAKLSEVNIPLGQSRYGGPAVDLPPGVGYPEGMRFAAQIDLAQAAPHDTTGMLPKRGQLIFFADSYAEKVQVLYADLPNEQLVRTVRDHEDQFFSGRLIDRFSAATETLAARYRDVEFDDEREYANEAGKIWDDYEEGRKSKIFGIYTNNQLDEDDILEVLHSNKVVLLQVGEDINDEGIFSVLIDRDDLKAGNFDRCTVGWAQT